jgi:large subunit ribosomal protein L25
MEVFEIEAKSRTEFGKSPIRRLRRAGMVPAIMYGAGKEPVPLTLSHNELLKRLEYEGFYSRILTINIEGQPQEKAVLKDIQRHPYRPTVMHLDFQRISETEKLQRQVPLHFINEEKSVGVKQSGGSISHHLTEIQIVCLPKDLPEFIEVDLTNLKLNEIVHLSDLVLPEGVEYKDGDQDLPVVSVHLARSEDKEEAEQGIAEPVKEIEKEKQ